MTRETPASILEWSRKTFGERSALSIATRASKEVNEVMCAILNDAPEAAIHEELADCAVMLWQVHELLEPGHADAPYRLRFAPGGEAARQNVCPALSAIQFQRRFTTVLEELVKQEALRAATDLGDVTRGVHAVQHAKLTLKDSMLLLERLAWFFGIDIHAHVDAKMLINRARNWERLENGSYQHVETPTNGHALAHPA